MSTTDAPATAPTLAELTGDYEIDPAHTQLGFVARHAMVTKVRGHFAGVSGRLHLDGAQPSRSTAEVDVDVASLTTGQDQRDGHLRGPDFFDVDQHPRLTFRSTAAEPLGDDRYRVTGDLTIRGVTRPIAFDLEYTGSATDPFGNHRVGFEGHAEVNRKDWGLSWNAALETGGFLVSDKVRLELDVSAIRLDPARPDTPSS
jgi:polyisoprenoid-binding protein YceI